MNRSSIAVKLWSGIILMVIIILLLTLLFQTFYLSKFYYSKEKEVVTDNAQRLAHFMANYDYPFNVPFELAIRKASDIVIVTDMESRIVHIKGSTELKKGTFFRLQDLPRIKAGEIISVNNTMIENLDTIVVGVPIFKPESKATETKQAIPEEINPKKGTITGAVYAISGMNKLDSTIGAIKEQFLYIFAGSILIASLLSYFLSLSFSRPMVQINDAAMEIAKGNYNTNIKLESSKEIKELGDTISNLAKQLSRVEKIRKDFIANVSHEIRTPLSYIQGYTEIILDGLAETEEDKQKYLTIITEETARLKKMVNEILELSQMEAGCIELKMTSFSMDTVIKRSIDKVLPFASKRNISIKFNKPVDDLLLCIADEGTIKQVLMNLLNNAIKHSYDHSNIIINAYRQGEKIYVCVRDFGEGIPKEDLPFIWDRFYTVDKAKSENSSGLGLAIVKNIIAAHGYDIAVNSVRGEGTEFCFWLQSYPDISSIEDTES